MKYPQLLEQLICLLQKMPGVGRKTAERYAFDLVLNWQEAELSKFGQLLAEAKEQIKSCDVCGAMTDCASCQFCTDSLRTGELLCIVSSPREIFSVEMTREFRGRYHVLGGLLSPLDGRGEEVLQLPKLLARLETGEVSEIVLALDSTLEGDTTALYLKRALEAFPAIRVSRLAFGIPVGSSLEYVDGGTLARAFMGRAQF